MSENFSRRNHLDKPNYELKYEYVPPAFRIDIYSVIKEACESDVQEYCRYRDGAISVNENTIRLYTVEDVEEHYNPDFFIEMLLKLEWHKMLSIVEFFLNKGILKAKKVNELFDYHNVGYRIDEDDTTDGYKVVVYYKELIADNEKLLESNIPFPAVKESIEAAKRYLIDPKNIDIANSIKSSVGAVEGYLKGYFDTQKKNMPTLGDCIKELKKEGKYPDNILGALEQIYVYRNRTENVGHGAPDYADLTKEDAMLCNQMAISFINYFFRKNKAQL